MPNFPAIPAPVGSNYQETAPDNLVRSPMDVGPAKVRRRTTANVRGLVVYYVLSAADEATLDTFYNTTTEGGSISFTYTHPRTNAVVTARFTQPPVVNWADGLYTVQVNLEILP